MPDKGSKLKIDKTDKNRILITETLPYETPLIFSNDGFYAQCKKNYATDAIRSFIFDHLVKGVERKKKFYTVPFKYRIRKTVVDFRQLSVIHPISQYEMRDFYALYENLICHYCSKSTFSIRAPHTIASSFYYKNSWENINKYKKGAVAMSKNDQLSKHSSSYYAYRGYDRLYKFFGSNEFLRLEKEFAILLTLDVSKCFDSIYSHSISWATKEKHYVKENLSVSSTFGQSFDSLMQHANHNETNGIVIGPEISRIFSEIIFQDVDFKVKARLEEKDIGHFQEADYEIRRYVDDVFIFARDVESANKIYRIYSEQLSAYNLHTNSSKSQTYERPFFTPKSSVIREVNHYVNEFTEKFLTADGENNVLHPSKIYRADRLIRSFIDAIKAICIENKVSYDDVSSYIISAFFERTKRLVNTDQKTVDEIGLDSYRDAIRVLLDLMFFFYSISSSVSASYKLCASAIILSRFSEKHLGPFEHTIKQRIFELSVDLLSNGRAKSDVNVRNFVFLEVLNVVLAISELGHDYLLPEDTILHLLGDNPGYFQLTSVLFYIKDKAEYHDARNRIFNRIDELLHNLEDVHIDTEKACLLLDMIVCPFVETKRKKKWLRKLFSAFNKAAPTNTEIEPLLQNDDKSFWFINWNEVDLLNALERKELRQVY
jgi:hypothetical protein